MRIQHNIMAMNAYRNYNTNTKALSGNLEKLSSGYKINRAGDDAAGLAISEKMRAQITGLDAAQKNVKDGISLVKTAEGAMQEIQDMLNRMDYLATQSANGTYDNEVDRANLQKEVTALKDEINRIADSANFNGIKLPDGSKAAEAPAATVDKDGFKNLSTSVIKATNASTDITLAKMQTLATDKVIDAGDTYTLNLGLSDGTTESITVKVEVTPDKKVNFVDTEGNVLGGSQTGSSKASAQNLADAFLEGLKQSRLGEDYTITADDNGGNTTTPKIIITAKEAGASGLTVTSADVQGTAKTNPLLATSSPTPAGVTITEGKDDITAVVANKAFTFYDGNNADKAVFEVNGKKFAVGTVDTDTKNLADDVTFISVKSQEGAFNTAMVSTTAATDADALADANQIAYEISQQTGLNVTFSTSELLDGSTTPTNNVFKFEKGAVGGTSGGLTLQIGDTPDEFNKMKVQIGDMHTTAMGAGEYTDGYGKKQKSNDTIADIDIGNQEGASKAIYTIKNAINYVSSVRGDLGAIQNRLEHTGNNLSVMAENIQDAESTIRDTDVANEMMSYVKNNILVQSAQAMLAQANQVPQGVLQLLG